MTRPLCPPQVSRYLARHSRLRSADCPWRGGVRGLGFVCCWLRADRLTLGDLAEVFDGEDDAVAVEVERDLLAVGARAQGARGHCVESDAAQRLGRLRGGEYLR